ncbi:gamma-glutamyltransferase [mine drainage metagenome]|uniref:Gamma-glutamyltransferase n=1 Tax=mine drainage metagenome TaxID=410659 RepID=T1AYF1_9ZZZZ
MSTGAVVAAHPLCADIGRKVLDQGGNAYDALIAVSAALPVVQPHANGLGSDFFAVIRDGGVRCLNGSGRSAVLATPEFFGQAGLTSVPTHGPLSSFMVPGLVASWSALAPATTLPFRELLRPAIRLARKGFVPSTSLRRAAARTVAIGDEDWRSTYGALPSRKSLIQLYLARTLSAIAEDTGHSFYHGRIAREIEADMRAKGGLLRSDDLEEFAVEWTSPLSVRYRGYEIYTNPPNSQGATELIWLNLLGRADLGSLPESEYVESLLRTMFVAYDYRSKVIGDPGRWAFPEELLRADYPYATSPAQAPAQAGGPDTTAFSVFDGRIGISAIQSNYMGFGAGHTVRHTGINLNNRGAYFTLNRDHHNALAPRKRTFHTLMATLATGPKTILLGSMGGDVQPQANVQVLTRLVDRGEGMQFAIAFPRFAYPATIYGSATLYAEPGVALGYRRARSLTEEERGLVGHAHGIAIGESIDTGIDPRGDGLVPIRGSNPR